MNTDTSKTCTSCTNKWSVNKYGEEKLDTKEGADLSLIGTGQNMKKKKWKKNIFIIFQALCPVFWSISLIARPINSFQHKACKKFGKTRSSKLKKIADIQK
jgi:hypothetical protein